MSDTYVDDSDDTGTTDTAGDTPPDVDWKAEAEKFKALHKKQEQRAKDNAQAAADLKKLREQSMSDVEKAVSIARAEARAEAFRESGTRLVDAEVKAATAGRNVDVKALLDGLDRSRFIDDDGNPDTDRIVKWVDKIAPPTDDRVPPGRGGPRSTGERPNDMNQLIRRANPR